MHYVRSLEQRVKQLEEEKLALQQKLGQVPGTNSTSDLRSNGSWENDVRDQMTCIVILSDCIIFRTFLYLWMLHQPDCVQLCWAVTMYGVSVTLLFYCAYHVCLPVYSPITLKSFEQFSLSFKNVCHWRH
jgi:hypothetical protein